MRLRRGFTLIEVLTTIAIFGILASITGYVYGVSLARSRDNQRITDLSSIKNALEQYYLVNKRFPHNTNYLQGQNSYPFVAKYELEEYKSSNVSGLTCDNRSIDTSKTGQFLAPKFISTIPEDPRYKIELVERGGSDCSISSGYGQYIYTSLMKTETDKPEQYYLMARLERPTFVSENSPVFTGFATTLAALGNWDLNLCHEGSTDPTGSVCTHNYYLKNSRND